MRLDSLKKLSVTLLFNSCWFHLFILLYLRYTCYRCFKWWAASRYRSL